ncbi:hypothetical protein AFERRID_08900 [Acidithiobacillus ferridurans]|uniref:Uncharacterized protein n=1 Tax=Acidithiobacillus ferridurans TaxID=1232575 RepID=A0A2Z6IGF0_ACIFI|nr:hypothetical protein AFERRID_08900 [Acidithiobacillus ferridurans]
MKSALRDTTQREKVLELRRYRHKILPWCPRISQNGTGTVTAKVSTTGDVLNGVIVCIKEIVYSHGELHVFQGRDVWIQSGRFYPRLRLETLYPGCFWCDGAPVKLLKRYCELVY